MDQEIKNLSTKLETSKSETALREEKVLQFWKEQNIFEKSVAKDAPKGEYVFYEGPPTANGKPGIHHLEARAFKDVIPRYKTMQGFHVRRKAGWDTHGLPVELEVEKELGLKSKKEIEAFGVAEFNQRCKKSVWKYLDVWNNFTERIGFWVDQKDPYVTYYRDYMESVWNVIKKIDDQNLLYKDYKIVPWCPRCGTGLSSHELAQGYKDVKDLSVTVKFKLKGADNTYILAWTTTPWTLLGNVALAVGEDIEYVKVSQGADILILAKARLSVIEGEYKILEEIKGKDLVGLEYEPLYPYLKENISGSEAEKLNKAFKVYPASFVTTEDGTGVVHTAVMYGADDFVLGTELGLPKFHLVGDDGYFLGFTGSFAGKFVKDEETAIEIIKELAGRGILFKKEKYEHSYPHCWRCKTPLIYFARDSWYVRMSISRDKLVAENEKINWEPNYIKEGRFGEWVREVKDWAISRERYWGTPMPIWLCDACGEKHVVGSIADIKENIKKSGNKYFIMRHGGAESNIKNVICSKFDDPDHLTEEGRKQVTLTAETLKDKKIDLIISSDFLRTKETAEIVKKEINYSGEIIFDARIRELNAGEYEGTSWFDYPHFFSQGERGAESLLDVKKRVADFLYEIENKYQGKNILIVSHESAMRLAFSTNYEKYKFNSIEEYRKVFPIFQNAEVRELDFVSLPHNEDFEIDLHKPYIDEVKLVCTHSTTSGQACGGDMNRVKEVMDVWFDSGSMPFAQDHYPFDFSEGKPFENKELAYPADYISEAIDQTRGWFYTLLAIGVLMGKGTPYKNVICLGHILDGEGKKMSKSIGNVIDPWSMIEKYGVDTLRLWMYGVNQPGESKNFDEKTVLELHRQVFGLLYNVLSFYELYRDKELEISENRNSENILDKWILAKLDELNILCVENLDNYRVLEPTRAIRDFIGDLSTWYLRRSRDRIKDGDKEARATLYFVLKNLAKMMAPFAPFAAEDIWLKLRNENDLESVHLVEWPKADVVDEKIITDMQKAREIVSLGLEARQKAGMKVRQPLSALRIKEYALDKEYTKIIKDELNIKLVQVDPNFGEGIILNTEITPELKMEGDYRELVRGIQDMRKKMGLTPSDVISVFVETDENGKKLIQKFEDDLKKIVSSSVVQFENNEGTAKSSFAESPESSEEDFRDIKIGELNFKISIQK